MEWEPDKSHMVVGNPKPRVWAFRCEKCGTTGPKLTHYDVRMELATLWCDSCQSKTIVPWDELAPLPRETEE